MSVKCVTRLKKANYFFLIRLSEKQTSRRIRVSSCTIQINIFTFSLKCCLNRFLGALFDASYLTFTQKKRGHEIIFFVLITSFFPFHHS